MKFMPLLFLPLFAFSKNISVFEGEYIHRHSLYVVSENKTFHNIQDIVKIQPVNDHTANILVESYTQNFHSCQLVGQAELKDEALIFKSPINKKLNRGKAATCKLKITVTQDTTTGEKTAKVEDVGDYCRLRYCGMSAELTGLYNQKTVVIEDKK